MRLNNYEYYTNKKLLKNISCIYNLTHVELPNNISSLLTLGLNFIPTPNSPNEVERVGDFDNFSKKLRTAVRLRNRPPRPKHPFRTTSTWSPPPSNIPELEQYISLTKELLLAETHITHSSNLSPELWDTLKALEKRTEFVIKKADKGACIVIENRSDYIEKGLSHLADRRTYKPLEYDPTTHLSEQILAYITNLKSLGYIDEITATFLEPTNEVRTQQLYFLKKIHKNPFFKIQNETT